MLNCDSYRRRRLIGALASLLAIAVLYAPLAAAAFSPSAMACCANGLCNIPNHHHRSNAAATTPASTGSHEDCEHNMTGKMAGMKDCSMDCSHDHEIPAVSSVTFVMPPAVFVPASMHMARAGETTRPIEIPRAIEPASPPPRILSNIL